MQEAGLTALFLERAAYKLDSLLVSGKLDFMRVPSTLTGKRGLLSVYCIIRIVLKAAFF
jgi:hypothetical protein